MAKFIEYTGYVEIPRLGIDDEDVMRLPTCLTTPEESPLTPDEIIERAFENARQWLGWLADTAPGRRDDYGQPTNYIPTSETIIEA